MTTLLLSLLALSAPAHATELPSVTGSTPYAEAPPSGLRVRAHQRTAHIGSALCIGASVAGGLGTLSAAAGGKAAIYGTLIFTGPATLIAATCTPMLHIGSLGARRMLGELDGRRITRGEPGLHTGLAVVGVVGLFGSTVTGLADRPVLSAGLGAVGTVGLITSTALGMGQIRRNRLHIRDLSSRVELGLAPQLGPDRAGLALVGRF